MEMQMVEKIGRYISWFCLSSFFFLEEWAMLYCAKRMQKLSLLGHQLNVRIITGHGRWLVKRLSIFPHSTLATLILQTTNNRLTNELLGFFFCSRLGNYFLVVVQVHCWWPLICFRSYFLLAFHSFCSDLHCSCIFVTIKRTWDSNRSICSIP